MLPAFTVTGITGIISVAIVDPTHVAPPYLGTAEGNAMPVSAIECGRMFIICDAPAWSEHDRLLAGSEADRAKAQAEAVARFHSLGLDH